MSKRRASRSPRREDLRQRRSRSRSGSSSASVKHNRRHYHRQDERHYRRVQGATEQTRGKRPKSAHRSGHRHSRRHWSRSSSSESERDQVRHLRKHKHKNEKRRKKEKKDRSSTNHAVNQAEYGKYGILRESDFHSKSVSFQAWLRDVKNMGTFNGPKWEAMELFKEYMEDYNTCTMPHKKYYDIEQYEMKRYQKQQRKAFAKQNGAFDKALDTVADEEQVRRERLDAREKKEQEEFRLVLQLMDKDKIEAMREQERLRAQMQLFYKSGHVDEARRLEQILNKVEDDPRLKR